MKKKNVIIFFIAILAIIISFSYWAIDMSDFTNGIIEDTNKRETNKLTETVQNGDIIFQISKSSQSKAIQLATGSKYSHVGIVYIINNKLFVFEAVQPVKLTPIQKWIERGKDRHYVVKRLKNSETVLTLKTLKRMKTIGKKYMGKKYDLYFEWTDDKIYCSELVWKIYKEATGIEIGKLEKLSDFDLSNKIVKRKLKERYGKNIPMDEKVISPVAMFNSNKLKNIEIKLY